MSACGNHAAGVSDETSLYGASSDLPYEGPAIVERSVSNGTSGELVLAFQPAAADGGAPDGGSDGGALNAGAVGALPLHLFISDLPTKAIFPLGTRVWLTWDAGSRGGFGPAPPFSYSVRDRKDGRLLLAAARPAEASLFAPLTFDDEKVTCETPYDDGCAAGTVTYSSFDVHGDATVTIDDGQTATVKAGGVDYTVELMSGHYDLASKFLCQFYIGPSQGLGLSATVTDTTPLARTLDVGAPIACAIENADLKQVIFNPPGVGPGAGYQGKVVYSKRGFSYPLNCFDFTTVIAQGTGATAVMEFCVSPGLFPEPAAGQEFWVTMTSDGVAAALKDATGGTLLLASASPAVPLDATTAAELANVLGIPVGVRQRCPYAPGTTLSEMTLGAASPIVIGPFGHATVPIGSKSDDAWLTQGGQTLYLSLVAR